MKLCEHLYYSVWDPKQRPLNCGPPDLWDSKWVLFWAAAGTAVCYSSNWKVIHSWKLNLLPQKDSMSCWKSWFWIQCEHHNCKRLERRLERSCRKMHSICFTNALQILLCVNRTQTGTWGQYIRVCGKDICKKDNSDFHWSFHKKGTSLYIWKLVFIWLKLK